MANEHQVALLAEALGKCLVASGIVRADADLTGPHLLLFAEDLERFLKELNTRPATPVEGLETVRYEIIETLPSGSTRWKCVEHEHHANSVAQMLEHPTVVNALVHRSQAEAIIAAKDETIRRQDIALRSALLEVERLKTDNAALTAWVKYLEDAIKAKGGNEHSPTQDAYDLACKAIEKHRGHAKSLETQLVAETRAKIELAAALAHERRTKP